ncbi:PREDICTED: N6-adenosine-methyltransferase MT-A70-like isoform X2 [Camelina sativa]|uniref:N6-adenosine-methyltransferase MT-A70-like isoform X2 n=1 Tax=Camelina sativa TaxID=90675 RepID=A0ABM0T7F0_CAMSA|nr:PREDICTED: N6-adenosine-methyltransferase MT-A70-like isoform X2 [Camelina sativa]
METESDRNDDTTITVVKDMRARLETRIRTQHDAHLELLSSLQSIVPDIVPSLDLSLKLISSFTNRPFVATPPLPEPKVEKKLLHPIVKSGTQHQQLHGHDSKSLLVDSNQRDSGAEADGSSGSPMALVRAMVAECLLQRVPFSPTDSFTVLRKLENDQNARTAEKAALRDLGGECGPILAVETALKSMAEENGSVELEEFEVSGKPRIMVLAIDRTRLLKELPESFQGNNESKRVVETPNSIENSTVSAGGFGVSGSGNNYPRPEMWGSDPNMGFRSMMNAPRGMQMMGMHHPMGIMSRPPPFPVPLTLPVPSNQKLKIEDDELKDVEALVSKKSFKEKQQSRTGEELLDLIHRPTAKEAATAAKFKSKGGSQVKYYCRYLTKEDCCVQSRSHVACNKRHFRRLIASHTEKNLGDCSFLDTCRHMKTCKYVHYELDMADAMMAGPDKALKPLRADYCSEAELGEAQWINCDIRSFRMDILGTFGVVMADPPWDIHMELPYGTMADDEMRTLNVPSLQTDGLIFLWVTGRAMELGRECLELWGYKRVEEIIWVKTNQLQRIIRTGRTGHWLNHSKEHCLVGIKGNPEVNRNIDTDVIVAEVRETSRKPDEMYAMLERIMPRARKLELFARMHNAHAGWLSLGNQLNGVRLINEGLRARYKASYPEVDVQPPSPPRASAMETDNEPMAIDSTTA